MKRKLCFLFVLPLLFTACEGVEDPNPELDGEVPPPPDYLRVFSTDNARTPSVLSMQYAFYLEEELFATSQDDRNALFGDGAFIDDGDGLRHDVDGEHINPYINIKPQSRTYDNFTLFFQWPFNYYKEMPLLMETWHSPKAEELNIPTTKEDNELICEVGKYNKPGTQYALFGKFYYYAGIKNIEVSADKVLLGYEAGVDISHKFRMVSAPTLLLATFPTFAVTCRIEDEKPTNLVAFNNSLLSAGGYAVKFAEVPTEKYEEITFTVAMDILLPDGGERTLTGSVKVAFE